jgi:hypothetical protein
MAMPDVQTDRADSPPPEWGPLTQEAYRLRRRLWRAWSGPKDVHSIKASWAWLRSTQRFKRRFEAGL